MTIKCTPRLNFLFLCALIAGAGLVYFFLKNSSASPQTSGTVVILNGTSSVGKSSIQKAFSAQQPEAWLTIGIDNFFVGVLPPKFYMEPKPEHYAVMRGTATEDAKGNKVFTLNIGPTGQNIMKGMHRAIAAYARAGNNVIVDYIAYDAAWRQDLLEALHGIKVFTVGVTASLETIEQREKARATSPQGHGRSIYDTVHAGWQYDFTIDTDNITVEQATEQIIAAFKKLPK